MTAYEPKQEVAAGMGVLPGRERQAASVKNVFTAASRVSGRVWLLVRITVPSGLRTVRIRVEKPQNNPLYSQFQREPI